MPGEDKIEITILPDGTIKAETDQISQASHLNADKFLQWIAEQAGGAKERHRKGHATHTHHHHEKEKA